MINYPYTAITAKDQEQLNYRLYSAIGVNMLKYNHDSSSTIRFLSCLLDEMRNITEDLNYVPNFTLTNMEFISIDRISGYDMSNLIGSFEKGNPENKALIGFSKFSNSYHILKQVEKQEDFTRHSLPAEAFFSDIVTVNNPVVVTSLPYVKYNLGMHVEDSSISILPMSGFTNDVKIDIDSPIEVRIFGRDIHDEDVVEIIPITTVFDHITETEFSFVESVMFYNTTGSTSVEIFPYITGNHTILNQNLVERDTSDSWPTLASVDKANKKLVFNIFGTDLTLYPLTYEPLKTVDIDIPAEEEILSYYCDAENKILYVTTSSIGLEDGFLYAFPLIIPLTYVNYLDRMRTKAQSVKVEYEEDSLRELYNIWVFPSSKTNDVELMSIYINDILYKEDILLDLISENIETNRFQIPFSDLFGASEVALVELRVYSDVGETITPLYFDRTKLKPYYKKDAITISSFTNKPKLDSFIEPSITTSLVDYLDHGAYGYGDGKYGGVTDTERTFSFGGRFNKDISQLFKLSSVGNIMLDGVKIKNVFDTFFYDNSVERIITSDTITHMILLDGIVGTDLDQALDIQGDNTLIGVY